MIFDLEPLHETVHNIKNNKFFIPNIREFSYIHIPGNFKNVNINDISQFEQKTIYLTHDYPTIIEEFCTIYTKLKYPYIIAHNGSKFDFLIIIAHIYRYLKNRSILKNLKFFDSYIFVKKLKIINASNGDLFKTYIKHYNQYADLLNHQHNSLPDCQMLLLWFSVIINKYSKFL